MFVLSIILLPPALLIGLNYKTSDGTLVISMNHPLGITIGIIAIIGFVLLLTSWLCVIGFAIKRKQWKWLAGLLLISICLPLYLILDPIE
jgi:hypothetical protein